MGSVRNLSLASSAHYFSWGPKVVALLFRNSRILLSIDIKSEYRHYLQVIHNL